MNISVHYNKELLSYLKEINYHISYSTHMEPLHKRLNLHLLQLSPYNGQWNLIQLQSSFFSSYHYIKFKTILSIPFLIYSLNFPSSFSKVSSKANKELYLPTILRCLGYANT